MYLEVYWFVLFVFLIEVYNEIHISLFKGLYLFINRLSSFHSMFHDKCLKASFCTIFLGNDTFHCIQFPTLAN